MRNHSHRNGGSAKPQYRLHLFIAGATVRSQRALTSVKAICRQHLEGRYDLQVTDVLQSPERVAELGVVATPTLIKISPPPLRRFIGDLSDTRKIVKDLTIIGTD